MDAVLQLSSTVGVESACDLACGTGTTALLLARRGIRMFGVDLSPAMCRLARQKARHAGLPLVVLQADMRSFRLLARISHTPTDSERRALRPPRGG